MQVIIDNKSGFCFGVKKAIQLAEEELSKNGSVYCLGDIVHNEEEVQRLERKGMKIINHAEYFKLKNCTVLIRAHGEPPSTYDYASANHIRLIEGSCPVVLKLQQRIKHKYDELGNEGSVVIFGKPTHPEVIGLNGQIENKAVIIQELSDIEKIDFGKPVVLFAQTTMSREKYQELKIALEERLVSPDLLDSCDSICGQVANRGPWLRTFCSHVDAVIFVGGTKSSNSKVLFENCLAVNHNSFFISSPSELDDIHLEKYGLIGVCGATSTPLWLMEEVADIIRHRTPNNV